MSVSRKHKNVYVADEGEDDDVTWTSWKFCTRDRIRELINGEPAENPELRALGLVETFSRTYSRPVLKTVMEFARAFNEADDWCMFRGTKIQYGKEEMRRVFSLPSGPFSKVSCKGLEALKLSNKEKRTGNLTISSLEGEFKSWRGPVRAVQELLLGKRRPTEVSARLMWYFYAHLSDSVKPAKPKPDWADLVLDVLKGQIESLKIHLKKTKAKAGTWVKQRCPVFCGTALMAILTYHGFSEEELSRDWKERGTSTRGQRARKRQGSATNERNVEHDCGGPSTVETGRRGKRRRIFTQVNTSKRKRDLEGDGEEPERVVTRQMAEKRKKSTKTKQDLDITTKAMVMKKILRRYKKRKSSRSELLASIGLANTQEADKDLGESIDQELLQQEVDWVQKKHGELHTKHVEKTNQKARGQEELRTQQVENMNVDARILAGLQKAQEEVSEYRKKLLESQEELHTQQMAKSMNENARLQARLKKAEEEANELKTRLYESQNKTRKAYASSQGWKDTWEGVSKALEQAKAEIQHLTLRVGFLSTASEMARSMKKKLEDESAALRKQLTLQSAMLEENWDKGAPENWNEGSPSAPVASEPNAFQTREPTNVILPVPNAVRAGPSRAQGVLQTMGANISPKLESLDKS